MGEAPFADRRRAPHRPTFGWPHLTDEVVNRTAIALKEAWPTADSVPRGPIRIGDLPSGLKDVIVEASRSFADTSSFNYGRELERCYGTEIPGLVRRGIVLGHTEFCIGVSDHDGDMSWEMQSREHELITTKWHAPNEEQYIDPGRYFHAFRHLTDDPTYFYFGVTGWLNNDVVRRLVDTAHYMPASRSGILLGHKILASLIVGQASRAWLEPMEIPRLPGVVTDLIEAVFATAGCCGATNRLSPPSNSKVAVVTPTWLSW